jgi:hypothetical protein
MRVRGVLTLGLVLVGCSPFGATKDGQQATTQDDAGTADAGSAAKLADGSASPDSGAPVTDGPFAGLNCKASGNLATAPADWQYTGSTTSTTDYHGKPAMVGQGLGYASRPWTGDGELRVEIFIERPNLPANSFPALVRIVCDGGLKASFFYDNQDGLAIETYDNDLQGDYEGFGFDPSVGQWRILKFQIQAKSLSIDLDGMPLKSTNDAAAPAFATANCTLQVGVETSEAPQSSARAGYGHYCLD